MIVVVCPIHGASTTTIMQTSGAATSHTSRSAFFAKHHGPEEISA
jgi:hypothetical protein